jgi:hypothetical protein
MVAAMVTAPTLAATPPSAPVVVAVVGEPNSVNVLHHEFRTTDGRDPVYPRGLPRPTRIKLPTTGTFGQRLAALKDGPLASMHPGVLYAVAGTRLLLVNLSHAAYDAVGQDALHATGVVDSVVGTSVGTAPKALAVVVLGGGTDAAWSWIAQQSWIDLASTSDYTISTAPDPTQCIGSAQVRAFSRSGRILFSSSGNTTDQPEALISPNGLPETYLVGGTDSGGNSWRPGHPEESDPFYAAGNVVRPYESGERFSYQAAAPDSLAGLTHFGGTSGATPLTAGWAATLVDYARHVVGSTVGTSGGALATGPRHPSRGPLSDGRLTRAELINVLHAVAQQHTGLPSGAAYAAEGYGALNAAALAEAKRIVDGTQPIPNRSGDDQADAAARQFRTSTFSRCP